MLSIKEDEYQRGLIITYDIAIHPILDFNLYTNAVVKIIKDSFPKFTIGLFGDWGTGKTTLMNSIYAKLQNDNQAVLVRFETWRYEREEQFALIPLLKTIAFALPDEKQFQPLKQKLKRGAIGFLKKTPDIVSSIISKYSENAGKIAQEAIDSFRKEFNSKVELFAEVDKDTLYFDGFEDIQKEIKDIRQENPAFRIVVFVDDLDRCSPKKTLEVLESIKVFLGMDGFVYVIGLSHDIVTKLIDIEYKETGVKGEQYIKKMIQIPITLPKWDNKDITQLIQDFKDKELIHKNYMDMIDQELISIAVENNPRELKRFLNNFIVAFEIFNSIGNFKANELLLIQAIQLRWNQFYNLLMTSGDKKFRQELKKYTQMDEDTRLKALESDEVKQDDDKNYVLRIRKLLGNYKTDLELWNFLTKNSDTLSNILDLTIYRRSVEVGIEPTTVTTSIDQEAYALLRSGKISEFNKRIAEFGKLNLSRADLSRADLSRADLSRADLSRADLRAAKLDEADLRAAKLDEADLRAAKLDEADLSEANLSEAIFIGAYLKGAILSGTNLRESVIISPVYSVTHTRIDSNTSFDGAIIDDPAFIHYIRQYTNKVPEKIANIEELKMKLEGMPFITNIKTDLQENLVRRSKLPFFQLRNGNL
jgi:GTPase SAR1 family protein